MRHNGDSGESAALELPTVAPPNRHLVSDQVFDALQQRILTLQLPPLARISEAEVAARMGVSRQPVREAFKRLERMGLLQIRPQSGTTISLISEDAIRHARFIRTALESQIMRTACTVFTPEDVTVLQELIDRQAEAIEADDADLFHKLDEDFHRAICQRAGHGYVWDLILDHKAHMDRVRRLSLDTASQTLALDEHRAMLAALAEGDADKAAAQIEQHLSRIELLIAQIKAQNHNWFVDGTQ